MFQCYRYLALAITAVFISFSMVNAQNLILTHTFDTPISTTAWNDDGSLLAVSSQTSIYIIDIHSQEISQLDAFVLEGGNNAPSEMFWSPDSTKLAVTGRSSENYSGAYLSILDTQRDILLLEYSEYPNFLTFSPDSRTLVLSWSDYIGGQAYDSRLFFLDIDSGMETEWRLGAYMGIEAGLVAWNSDGNQLAIDIGGRIIVFNMETHAETTSFQAEEGSIYNLAWNPEGDEIITYGYNLRRWNAATGQPLSSVTPPITSIYSTNGNMLWLPDNTIIMTSGTRTNVIDAATGNLLYYYELPEGFSADWSPLGQLAVSTEENQLSVYAFEPIPAPSQLEFEVSIEAHSRSDGTDALDGLARWSPQGDILLTNANRIINLSQADALLYSIHVENAQLDKSLFSPDGRIVAIGLSDRASSHYEIQVWDVQANQMLHQFTGHGGSISELEFNAENSLLASGSSDTTIRVWDLSTGEEIAEMWGHVGSIADIAFSPDSQLLASVADTTMRVWDSQSGESLQTVNPYSEYLINGHYTYSVKFSPDGQQIIYQDKTNDHMRGGIMLRAWDLETETQNYYRERMPYLSDIFYSEDSSFYVLTNLYAEVEIYEAQSNTEIEVRLSDCTGSGHALEDFRDYWLGPNPFAPYSPDAVFGNLREVHWLDFSPDSQLIATLMLQPCLPESVENSSEEMFEFNTIWLVNPSTGAVQHILRGNESPAYRMFFSPDGSQLLTQHLDGGIKLWDVESGEEISIAGL